MVSMRIRGIYATALTAALDEVGTVVDASSTIRDRFDRSFEVTEPAVDIETTADRQGITVVGDADSVSTVREHLETEHLDTLSWPAVTPRDAVCLGTVVGTTGGGAIVDLGPQEGYLPFDAVDAYVEEGDTLHVRVARPTPPWSDDRPVLSTDLQIGGTLATLVWDVSAQVVGTPDRESDRELARITELLDVDVPAGWGIRWERSAIDADLETLGAALERQRDRVDDFEGAVEPDVTDSEAPRVLERPLSGAWLWFGRSTRFDLDDVRTTVVRTLPGHHRIKAGTRGASVAVDFAERLGPAVSSFPVGAVFDQFGPAFGDEIDIRHGKPDGRCYPLGTGEVIETSPESGTVTVEREIRSSGTYDALDVERAPGDTATSTFREGRWWYPTTYRDAEGSLRGTYININTPLEVFPETVRYVDLHVDVVKWTDGEVAIVDRDALADAVSAEHISARLAEKAGTVAEQVADAVRE
jgi:protein associated with RNAse G/E